MATAEGYAAWAATYDEPGNQLLDIEGPIVREILAGLPCGVAVDAACGTGRHARVPRVAADTRSSGWTRRRRCSRWRRRGCPAASFHEAAIHALPLADDSADLVLCAVALSHVPDLAPVLAEFVRVLRPEGHLVISDSRGVIGDIGLPLVRKRADDSFRLHAGRGAGWRATTSQPRFPSDCAVRRCEEPRRPSPIIADDRTDPYDGSPAPEHVPGDAPDIWALHAFAIAAANAAWRGNPAAIVWHFQRSTD